MKKLSDFLEYFLTNYINHKHLKDYLKSKTKSIDFIQNFYKEYKYVFFNFDTYFENFSRNVIYESPLDILETQNFREFKFLIEKLYTLDHLYENHYFSDITDEKNLFWDLCGNILKSSILDQYYKDDPLGENLFNKNDNILNDFKNGLIFTPLPFTFNGFTDHILFVFIKSFQRKINFDFYMEEKFEKIVNIFYSYILV